MIEEVTTILYIDDDPDDLMIFGESIRNLYPGISVLKAQSGEEGINFLKFLEQENRSFPSLIVLDMNMPKMDGRQTMLKIRSKESWDDIPIVIFTTSSNIADVEFCKNYGIECITKPMSYNSLNHTIRQLVSYCNKQISTD
jgi:CheY-like chemotaxis protein